MTTGPRPRAGAPSTATHGPPRHVRPVPPARGDGRLHRVLKRRLGHARRARRDARAPGGAVLDAGNLAVARVRVDDALYERHGRPPAGGADREGAHLPVHARQPSPAPALQPCAAAPRAGSRSRSLLVRTRPWGASPPRRRRAGPHHERQGQARVGGVVVLRRVRVADMGREERATLVSTASTGETTPRPPHRARSAPLALVVTQDERLELARARWNGSSTWRCCRQRSRSAGGDMSSKKHDPNSVTGLPSQSVRWAPGAAPGRRPGQPRTRAAPAARPRREQPVRRQAALSGAEPLLAAIGGGPWTPRSSRSISTG